MLIDFSEFHKMLSVRCLVYVFQFINFSNVHIYFYSDYVTYPKHLL